MKKLQIGGLFACLLLALSACTASPSGSDTAWTVRQMAEEIWTSQADLSSGTEILPEDESYSSYLTASYGLDPEDIADGAILAAGGASAREVAVLRLQADASPDAVAEALQVYLENRAGAFTGYLPEEAALLEEAEVVTQGTYVALLACEDVPAAREVFDQCFTQAPPSQPSALPSETEPASPAPSPTLTPSAEPLPEKSSPQPAESTPAETPSADTAQSPEPAGTDSPSPSPAVETAWHYDEARLLTAWAAGDWSTLAAEDQAILDTCATVIDTVAPEGLSDYEKELAIHDWMIVWGHYDSNTLSQLPDFQENPNHDNPYGFLIDGTGICLGYTTTFQLFMNLLGIECITVEGSAYGGTSDHAWNQVCLDGDWYCVDVTWDDPTTFGTVSEQTSHRYFNVTSQHMRDTDHQWDESAVPEATGTRYAWH